MANYEDGLFDQIVAATLKPEWTERQNVAALRLLHTPSWKIASRFSETETT